MFQKSVDFSIIEGNVRNAFSKIKEEFSEHLEAINENTNEIQANYEYLCELESKIDKLAERIDELCMFVKHPSAEASKNDYNISPLTKNEQEVFQALYAMVNEKGQASYLEIGRRIGLPETLVQSYITNLIEKGIPVQKRYIGSDVWLLIEQNFCEIQAKENILGISEVISEKVILQ
ncbi:MAG: hypothetical protein V1837_03200 [Candidatus Woesearchaeota archaeon]